MMRILLTGQCSLHWGRMEYGNLGNYAIIEPLVRELHRVFPNAEIYTTFQMTEEFLAREGVVGLPMDLYYGWKRFDLAKSIYEVFSAWIKEYSGISLKQTAFMKEVLLADLIIDFSGDIWGDNANLVGKNRYLVGACKDLVAHWHGKPLVMLAGSLGPFKSWWSRVIARSVLKRFDVVTVREPVSLQVLQEHGISTSNIRSLACPSFLFESRSDNDMQETFLREQLSDSRLPTVGVVICGWNMPIGPFSRWPREDNEYHVFVEMVRYITDTLGARVCLLSHNNAFTQPPDFMMTRGRDYQLLERLHQILVEKGAAKNVRLIEGVYDAAQSKAIIRQFDMLVSGRIHAAVAGMSQCIPTVILDYGHEPKAHKSRGFAALTTMDDMIADSADVCQVIEKVRFCWNNRETIKQRLVKRIPEVQQLARENFSLLPGLLHQKSPQ